MPTQQKPQHAADPGELAAEIEVLEEQISVLEEGLPGASGMQRAALAKEVAEYRRDLDDKREELRKKPRDKHIM